MNEGANDIRAQEYQRHRDQALAGPLWPEIVDYLSHLRIERGSSDNTLASYQRDLLRYAAYLTSRAVVSPAQVDSGHIADLLQVVTTGEDGGTPLAQRSAARVLASVRGAHKYWAQEGRTSHDPAAQVSAPKLAESLPKALSLGEVTALLKAPNPATAFGLRDRALLEFLYATGARITEAVTLDVDDIHGLSYNGVQQEDLPSDNALLVVRLTGKGSKQRITPMGTFAQRAIGDYLTAGRPELAAASGSAGSTSSAPRRRPSSPALFLNRLGGRLSRQSAWTILQRHAVSAQIAKEVSPHTLRHTCATHMLEGGADIRLVQELLGHASVTTTQIYTKVTAESLQETYAMAHPRAR